MLDCLQITKCWGIEVNSFFLIFFKKLFILLLCWGYIVAFTKIFTIYHTWIHPLHNSPLSPPPLILGIVLTGLIFPFTFMCTQHLHLIHPPIPFPTSSALPLVPIPQTGPVLLSGFVKEKKWHFCFFKIAIQAVSLWHFYVYMYYNLFISWLVHLFYFSSFCLSLFLMVISTGLKILYSFLYREYINHIHLYFSHMWNIDLIQIQQYYQKQVMLTHFTS
jgi:hypothetical protein